MNNDLMFSSDKRYWETPQSLFLTLHAEFNFTLDAAASPGNAKCSRFFTEQVSAFDHDWTGRVFCNPPYGRTTTGKFIRRGYEEFIIGNAEVVVLLVPARTDTRWFHDYVYGKTEYRFLKGRVIFEINGKPVLGKDGRPMPAPFPSMLVIYR